MRLRMTLESYKESASTSRFLCFGGLSFALTWRRAGGGEPTNSRARRFTSLEARKGLGFRGFRGLMREEIWRKCVGIEPTGPPKADPQDLKSWANTSPRALPLPSLHYSAASPQASSRRFKSKLEPGDAIEL